MQNYLEREEEPLSFLCMCEMLHAAQGSPYVQQDFASVSSRAVFSTDSAFLRQHAELNSLKTHPVMQRGGAARNKTAPG